MKAEFIILLVAIVTFLGVREEGYGNNIVITQIYLFFRQIINAVIAFIYYLFDFFQYLCGAIQLVLK